MRKLWSPSIIIITILTVLTSSLVIMEIRKIKASTFQGKAIITDDISINTMENINNKVYTLYVDNKFYKEFTNLQDAINFGGTMENSSIKEKGKHDIIWDNYLPYNVFTDGDTYVEFETFKDALDYGKKQERAFIYHRKDNSLIWSNADLLKKKHKIKGVPVINQFPELPRGCEVTSLCMLMNYKGINVDKMTLAKEIKKESTNCEYKNGEIYCGDPNDGFIGSMTSFDDFGLGVYHKPIYELLAKYAPRNAIDLTGAEIEDLFYLICKDTPIWVIINDKYAKLPPTAFEKWNTPNGEIKITYNEHSVLITGYDEDYIYFNDPLGEEYRAKYKDFKEAFIQMGSQAVTLSN